MKLPEKDLVEQREQRERCAGIERSQAVLRLALRHGSRPSRRLVRSTLDHPWRYPTMGPSTQGNGYGPPGRDRPDACPSAHRHGFCSAFFVEVPAPCASCRDLPAVGSAGDAAPEG